MGEFRPKANKKAKGERSQAHIIARLLEVGYTILLPYGDNTRYDLVIEDDDGNFHRIQCKTGWLEDDGAYIRFAAVSTYYHTKAGRTGYGRRGYQGEVDYFAVYCDETKKVYFMPISEVTNSEVRLRLKPTVNKQEKFIRWAQDYEL